MVGADFEAPESGVWPSERLEREQWTGQSRRNPSPRGRPRPSEADPDEDTRWKWGLEENYVDGDDVRDPETGAVHPAFVAFLEHLGITYADVSQSDAGIHAIYRESLSEGMKQASWQLVDGPWDANEDPPRSNSTQASASVS